MIVSKAANFREKIPSLGPGHLLARPGQCPDNVQGMSRACPGHVLTQSGSAETLSTE